MRRSRSAIAIVRSQRGGRCRRSRRCGALRDEFFDGAVEGLVVHLELALERSRARWKSSVRSAANALKIGGGRVVALEEELVHLAVGEGVEQDGARGLAVAAGAADLLVVALDGAGQRGVDDGADVGLVDAHAEGDGGDDDFELAGEEVALDALAGGGVEAGVVGGGELRAEVRGELFGGLARGSVDDGGAVRRVR